MVKILQKIQNRFVQKMFSAGTFDLGAGVGVRILDHHVNSLKKVNAGILFDV